MSSETGLLTHHNAVNSSSLAISGGSGSGGGQSPTCDYTSFPSPPRGADNDDDGDCLVGKQQQQHAWQQLKGGRRYHSCSSLVQQQQQQGQQQGQQQEEEEGGGVDRRGDANDHKARPLRSHDDGTHNEEAGKEKQGRAGTSELYAHQEGGRTKAIQ